MLYAVSIVTILLAGCSIRSTYPLMGGLAGGAAGSIGGPVVGGLSAGAGVLAGEALKNKDEVISEEFKIIINFGLS